MSKFSMGHCNCLDLTLFNSINCKEDSSSRTHLLFIIHYLLKISSEQSCQTYDTSSALHVDLYFILSCYNNIINFNHNHFNLQPQTYHFSW